MTLKIIGWLVLGAFLGGLVVMFFARLKRKELQKSMDLKDEKIRLLEKQLEIASRMEEEEID